MIEDDIELLVFRAHSVGDISMALIYTDAPIALGEAIGRIATSCDVKRIILEPNAIIVHVIATDAPTTLLAAVTAALDADVWMVAS